jgi:hypothetical protein
MRVQLHAVSFTGAMRFGANLEFDVAEYSLANYCAHLAEPKPSPMVPLPVFASRVFRHNSIYVNAASNIGRGVLTRADDGPEIEITQIRTDHLLVQSDPHLHQITEDAITKVMTGET